MKNIGCIKHNDGENKIEFLDSEYQKKRKINGDKGEYHIQYGLY